jgi:hypothetical protein
MSPLFNKVPKKTQVIISVLAGIVIFIITWFYINSYYTLGIEDDLLFKETLVRYKLMKTKPAKDKQFVFISTGKDLNLVDDTAGYGNAAVSDRYKLLKLMQAINKMPVKPKYVLLDLQFYLPYVYSIDDSIQLKVKKSELASFFPDKSIDDSLQNEITKCKDLGISVSLMNDKVAFPLYKGTYGLDNYVTYGSSINKFKIYYNDLHISSIPALLHEKIDSAVYSANKYATFCNNRLCFNYIWLDYYYDGNNIKDNPNYQVYHIGSLLPLLSNPQFTDNTFKDKVVLVGNFEQDVHATPDGKMPGTVILADIYLSLLNGRHYASYLWILFVIILFSFLSHKAIFSPLPNVKFKSGFVFVEQITSYINQYISFFGILMAFSILSILIFNITISLFLPATIFSAIDFFTQKKYKRSTT